MGDRRKRGKKVAERAELDTGVVPRTPEELHEWIVKHLGVNVPRGPVLEGHTAPFEYLRWAFFGGDGPRDCVVWANRGGGKTYLGAVATLLDLVFRPGIEVRVLGGSLEQSRRMLAHLRRLFDAGTHPELAALVKGRMTERRLALTNGSEVELLAASQTSVRGTRVQKVRCDEVDLFDPEIWEAVQLTTRSKVIDVQGLGRHTIHGSVECLSTMHEPHGVMHALVKEARAGRRALFRWGVVDVLERCGRDCGEATPTPCALWAECHGRAKRTAQTGHVTIDDAIALKRRVCVATWESEMLCRRPRRTSTVLPEFDAGVHVFEGGPTAREGEWVAGMDFGIRSPAVVVWGHVDAKGVLRIMDERHVAGVVLAEHAEAMRRGLAREGLAGWPKAAWVGIDPAGLARNEQTGVNCAEVLRDHGFTVRAARRGTQEGLGLVRARLAPASGPARLFVHARCVKLIESLERFRYAPGDPCSETPLKGEGWDHAVDALRYLVVNLDRPRAVRRKAYIDA